MKINNASNTLFPCTRKPSSSIYKKPGGFYKCLKKFVSLTFCNVTIKIVNLNFNPLMASYIDQWTGIAWSLAGLSQNHFCLKSNLNIRFFSRKLIMYVAFVSFSLLGKEFPFTILPHVNTGRLCRKMFVAMCL